MSDYEIARKLRDCLLQLTTGKATERKKQLDNLKLFLNHPAYVLHMNKSSARNTNVQHATISISWNKVFVKIIDYIQQECAKYRERESANDNLSSIVRNNIAKEKRMCSDLFRCFVKAMKQNKQYEMAKSVVMHILAVLDEPFTKVALGVDYSNVFLKYILYDPFMCLNVPADKFDDAIHYYCKLLKNPPSNWNRSLMTQILLNLLTLRLNMGAWHFPKTSEFLIHMLDAVKSEKASKHHENLLQCLLLLCQNLRSDYPIYLCYLGEAVLLPIMQLWKTRPSEKTQELMLEFIRFQLALHHPKGAQQECDGARAYDWSNWKNHLINLYKLIMTELTTLCERNKYPSNKEAILKPTFISVATEVFAQVFNEPVGTLDITQFNITADITSSTPCKKRKIDVSFKTLIENLSSTKIIPWLQVISAFLLKYSEIILIPDAVSLLDALIDVHMSCNNIETKNWLLSCCQSFVEAFGRQDAPEKGESTFQWQRVWELGVKSVALMHQCQEAGHNLLTTMLYYKIITPKSEFYNLYTPGSSNKVTEASLKTLATFLEKFSLSSGCTGLSLMKTNSFSENFENQVLEWLFSRKNDDNSPFQVVSDMNLSTYEMFAHVASLLCLQNNNGAHSIKIKSTFEEPFQWISDIENELLSITFNLPLKEAKFSDGPSSLLSGIIVQPVWDKILNFIIDATGGVLEEQISNKQFSTPCSFIRHASLLFEMLQIFYFKGIFKRENLESAFTSYFQTTLTIVVEMLQKSEISSESIILLKECLQRIIIVITEKNKSCDPSFVEPFVSQVIKYIPEGMLMYILNFSLVKPDSTAGENQQNCDVDDNMFDDPFAEPQQTFIPAKDDDTESLCPSSETDSCHLMDVKSLPEDFQLQLQCLDILSQFTNLLVTNNCIIYLESFSNTMLQRLVSVLPENDKRFKGAADVHQVLQILKCILLCKNLDDNVIEKVLCSFRLILNQLSQMHDLCQAVLKLFPLLLSHVFERSSVVSANINKQKSKLLHLLSVLCKRELEQNGSSLTSLLVAEILLKIVKMEPGITWNAEIKTLTGRTSTENMNLVFDSLIKFMNSPFISVRLFMARNINQAILADIADRNFQTICSKTFDSLSGMQQDTLSRKDEFSNQISTFLHYLSHAILEFPCLEIESIFLMFRLIKSNLADQDLISRVLKHIAVSLGYENATELIEFHLTHLARRWFEARYELSDFPVKIFEANTLDSFIKKHYKVLIPQLFYLGNVPCISNIAESLQLTLTDALYSCLSSIQSLLVCDYASSSSTKLEQLFLYIPQKLCKKDVVNKLDEVMVCLLSMIKENGVSHTAMCQVHCKYFMSPDDFVKIVNCVMQYADCSESYANSLYHKADCIPNIFLDLNVMLHKSLRPHESRRILCMYDSFLNLLLPYLGTYTNTSMFIIREVVCSLINFLIDNRKHVVKDEVSVEYCSHLLLSICKEAMQSFKEIVGELLPFMVSNIIPFVDKTKSGQKVLHLLEFLVIESQSHLIQFIPYLDPFPNEEHFSNLSRHQQHVKYKHGKLTLEQEIKYFLISRKMMGKGTKKGLEHLCNQLKSKRSELEEILTSLKERTVFTEDVGKSVLHELVCHLSSLCSPANDFEIQKAASNCLGAIGPVFFSSVVLQPSPHAITEKGHENLNVLQKSYSVILNILADYLFHENIHIKVAASKVLKEIFNTKIGYHFFKEYIKMFPGSSVVKYAYPFYAFQNQNELLQNCKYKLNIEGFEISAWLVNGFSHSDWIKNLVCVILECGLTRNNFYECLVPICKEETSFCEKIIPYLIHMILLTEDEEMQKVLSAGISSFFSHFSQWLERMGNNKEQDYTSPSDDMLQKASVQTMLSILHYIWLHPNNDGKRPRNVLKDLWLNLNYLEVAQAAQYCQAHFTAILYTELWCDLEREKNRMSTISSPQSNFSDSQSLECSPLSFIGSQDQHKASVVYDILLDAYSRIGDSDAISGCDLITADSQAILKHSYIIEKKWDGLLKLNDKRNSKLETLQALQLTGLNHILLGYSQSLLLSKNGVPSQDIVEYQCQAAWRMSQWDLPVADCSSHGFQEYFYKSQQCYVIENELMFQKNLDLARKTQFEKLNNTSLESVRNILSILSNFQLISVLEDFSKIRSDPDLLKKLLDDWNQYDQVTYDDFEFVEPVSWLKCVLLKQEREFNVNKHIIISELKNLLEKHCVRARNELHLEVASSAVQSLRNLPSIGKKYKLQWEIEEAKILWTKKEYSIANKILKSALHSLEKSAKENSEFSMSYGEALTLRGKWLAETCSENSSVIMRDYLEKAVNTLENCEHTKDQKQSNSLWDAYLAVARYADAQYQSIANYKKSTAYQIKQELMQSAKEEAKRLKTKASTEDQRKTHVIITKQLKIDQEEMESLDHDQKQFLNKAITSYLKCLRGTDSHDLWAFRLVSLWFQNLSDEETNNIISNKINDLQCYKFLPLMYQLAARMGTHTSGIFANTLTNLIIKIAIDHPHHSLPVILALSNADKDPVDGQNNSGKNPSSSQQSDVLSVKERMVAAKKIIALLSKSKITALVKDYSALCDAYISLAYLPVDKKVKKGPIPSDQSLLKFRNLYNIPIISEEIKVDRACEYKNIIGIHSFSTSFRMCGGITMPKVIKCLGTDGIEREQLVKGRDDLRQDAVMQQVFYLVNHLLQTEMETKKRRLHIRTYKVVPVSRRSGVIQWCEGTQVLSQYLVGNPQNQNGAHYRYYPHMASHIDCRRKMETISSHSLLQKKREIFDSICANYPPVFRYFFLEHFPEPSAWFERRLCYTKSVAASSIVGYILGLGDRHVNNILIDKNSAEVVHIDFGIAFEKGRVLATPETVPFRLTRDIVDGMGISGVEGIFKRCCEKTLEVMRKSQDVLLTILDVLLHDPLYEWTVPSSKSQSQTSRIESQEVNKLAERALMRLQQKLQGLEEGVAMSIEGQVNLLIQQARDPNNLCRLYAGWQPYL